MNDDYDVSLDEIFPLDDEDITSYCVNHPSRLVHWSRLLCDECQQKGHICAGCACTNNTLTPEIINEDVKGWYCKPCKEYYGIP